MSYSCPLYVANTVLALSYAPLFTGYLFGAFGILSLGLSELLGVYLQYAYEYVCLRADNISILVMGDASGIRGYNRRRARTSNSSLDIS